MKSRKKDGKMTEPNRFLEGVMLKARYATFTLGFISSVLNWEGQK